MEQTPTFQPLTPNPAPSYDRAADVRENKDIAALGYAWVLSVFVYFYKRKQSPFVAFHARQGIALFILSIACWFVPGMPGKILELIILCYMVVGFLAAAQGKSYELPLIFALSHGDWQGLRASWKSLVQSVVKVWRMIRRKAGKKTELKAELTVNAPNPSPTHP